MTSRERACLVSGLALGISLTTLAFQAFTQPGWGNGLLALMGFTR